MIQYLIIYVSVGQQMVSKVWKDISAESADNIWAL